MEDLLAKLHIPIYVLIGKKDPWLQTAIYEDILGNYQQAFGKQLETVGHCPHDETPDEVNQYILSFLTLVEDTSTTHL
jgi:pimeloyl-ACP methyl ester carboxylesterase